MSLRSMKSIKLWFDRCVPSSFVWFDPFVTPSLKLWFDPFVVTPSLTPSSSFVPSSSVPPSRRRRAAALQNASRFRMTLEDLWPCCSSFALR